MNLNQALQPLPKDRCPICQSQKAIFFKEKDGFAILQCSKCQMIHVNPTPSEETLEAHYNNPAYFQGSVGQGYDNYSDIRKALSPFFKRRLDTLARHFPKPGHLMDYGCAAGYFLEMAQSRGWQIAGVELSRMMGKRASELLNIPIHSHLDSIPNHQFDVITFWEVIEHLPNPMQTLGHFYNRLKPGGAIMLSTPNTGHWQAIDDPNSWTAYCPPSHLLYFTKDTLTHALKKAGFKQISVQGVAPLPPLPRWLQKWSQPLKQALASGNAKCWPVALYSWRAIRIFGWGWQKLAYSQADIFTTLEAIAFK